ncbi:unnamed protein product, partial [Phaeothamnion confervicola]
GEGGKRRSGAREKASSCHSSLWRRPASPFHTDMSLRLKVTQACTELRSKRATDRKKAAQEVMNLVASEAIKSLLFSEPGLWSNLVASTVHAAKYSAEFIGTRAKEPPQEAARLLWYLVRMSDDTLLRSLASKADVVLHHLRKSLADDRVRLILEVNYMPTLIRLLSSPTFLECVTPEEFEHVLRFLMEMAPRPRAHPSYAICLQQLLCNYGRDIHTRLEPVVQSIARWCAHSHDALAPAVLHVFPALVALLQSYGATCAPMLCAHGRDIYIFVMRTEAKWKRNFKDHVLAYLRLHLHIAAAAARTDASGGSDDPIMGQLDHLLALLLREADIVSAVSSAAIHTRGGRGAVVQPLDRKAREHVLACADVMRFWRERHGGGDGRGCQGTAAAVSQVDEERARKRRRRVDPWKEVKGSLLRCLQPQPNSGSSPTSRGGALSAAVMAAGGATAGGAAAGGGRGGDGGGVAAGGERG